VLNDRNRTLGGRRSIHAGSAMNASVSPINIESSRKRANQCVIREYGINLVNRAGCLPLTPDPGLGWVDPHQGELPFFALIVFDIHWVEETPSGGDPHLYKKYPYCRRGRRPHCRAARRSHSRCCSARQNNPSVGTPLSRGRCRRYVGHRPVGGRLAATAAGWRQAGGAIGLNERI
jgi:hypothetical protein